MSGELDRYRRAEQLASDFREEATRWLIAALSDEGVGESPGDYDAPSFLYPVAEAAAESLASRFTEFRESIMAQTRTSHTAAFYVARLLRHQGQPGVEPLLELCRHPHAAAREQAVSSLQPQYQRCSDPRLLAVLLEMMADPDSGVTYQAVTKVKYLLEKMPEVLELAPLGLVEKLLARCREHPQAGTFTSALHYFQADPRVFAFQVEQAAAGHEGPCMLLYSGDLARLDPEQIGWLCAGRLTGPLVALLGRLGDRARAAAPRLLELRGHPELGKAATMALLGMPSQVAEVLPLMAELYLREPALRDAIFRLHPDRAELAREVLPRLAPAVGREYGEAFRGVARFGALAVGEAKWLAELARLGIPDPLRDGAVALLAEFGEAARPAFGAFYKLLEYSSTRRAVLLALIKLGPVACEFAEILEVLRLEARPAEWDLLDQALAAVRA